MVTIDSSYISTLETDMVYFFGMANYFPVIYKMNAKTGAFAW